MTNKYCAHCKHVQEYGIHCEAPQNIKSESINIVTGKSVWQARFSWRCEDLRANPEACGPDGMWHEEKARASGIVHRILGWIGWQA